MSTSDSSAAGNQERSDGSVDGDVDVIIIGAGPAGMSAAIVAHAQGLDALLLEKTDQVGGTAAWSAGMMWFIDTGAMREAGFNDSPATARRYFAGKVGADAPQPLQDAFITQGRTALDFLVAHSDLRVAAIDYPDYYPEDDGGLSGRAHAPAEFDGRLLGRNFRHLRGPIPAFAPLGGMMLDFADIMHFMTMTRSPKSTWHMAKLLARHGRDRLRHHRGTRLVNGNALVGRLYQTILDRQIPLWRQTRTDRLLVENGRVTGVAGSRDGQPVIIRARRGVILATGGYPANRSLRLAHSPKTAIEHSISLATNVGDGITLAMAAGARLDNNAAHTCYYVPVSLVPTRGREPVLWGHWGLDRAKPGFIAVGADGRRFANEAASYHEFTLRMLATGISECWLIADRAAVRKYGIGAVLPGGVGLRGFLRSGYLRSGRTLAALAAATGIDAAGLEATVTRFNGFAATGIDLDFAKGASAYDRFFADHQHTPNMTIGPIASPPYFAVKMVAGDFGTSRGLVTGANGEVLDAQDRPIAGLYACGNDMNSPTAGQYLGAGITLGPALTFGYLAAMALAGNGKAPPEPATRSEAK